MAKSRSSHRIADPPSELYKAVHLYSTSIASARAQKPVAKPAGAQAYFLFSADTSNPNYFPRLVDAPRLSAATRNTAPCVTRISLPIGRSH